MEDTVAVMFNSAPWGAVEMSVKRNILSEGI